MRFRPLVVGILLFLCGGLTPSASDDPPGGAKPGESPSGAITGTVRVLKRGGDEPLATHADAVVYLRGPLTPPPEQAAQVDQVDKTFQPRVLPIVKGQKVTFHNSDRVRHNAFCHDPRKAFDLGRFPKGETRTETFPEAGFFKVYCDIHQQMVLDIVVLENRYFAVTDEAGAFRIEGVPPGTYSLAVWHVYGGAAERKVTVGPSPVALEPMTITSTKVLREIEDHPDKHGGDYRRFGDDEPY